MYKKNFLSIADFSTKEIWKILDLAKKLKKEIKNKNMVNDILKNKNLVMLFEKPSLRTKLSFEIGITKLGGHAVYLTSSEVGLGFRESIADTAQVISSMADILVVRTYHHTTIQELAKFSKIPVINGLSNLEHPCQALADFMTMWEIKGEIKELKIAFVGDGDNNITHSLCLGSVLLGASFFCASPKDYWMKPEIVAQAKQISVKTEADILEIEDPKVAVKDADIVYTDTWISMGDESEKRERLRAFKPYQINDKLLQNAKKNAIFMHDLPAYRGNEVTKGIIDGKQSVVFQQAENRMWVQMGLIIYLSGI